MSEGLLRPTKLWEVPSETPASTCKSRRCRAAIYMVETKQAKRMPVDCNTTRFSGCMPPIAKSDVAPLGLSGWGVSHFITCPDAPTFRRAQKR